MRPDSFLIPEVRHVRMVHCYLPVDATEEVLEHTALAVSGVGRECGGGGRNLNVGGVLLLLRHVNRFDTVQ